MCCPSSIRPSVVNFSHFRLLLWNRWTEFNKTWQEARTQYPLASLCFSGRSENKMVTLASDLLRHFSTSPLKPLNRFQQNLTGSKISTSSIKFVFFGLIRKTRWPPWPLIGWDIFNFSETAERNSTKLDRKQVLNVLYQVCVFRAVRKNKMVLWLLIGWDIFNFSSETTEQNSTKLDRKQDLNVLYQVCVFFLPIGKSRWPPWPLIGWDIFDFSSETTEQNSTTLDRKQDFNVLHQVCVFRAERKKQDGHPGLWLAATFSTSPLKLLNRIQRNLTGRKISTFSTKSVFFLGWSEKIRWPPWPLIGWDILDFSSETAEQNSTKLDRKQDLNILYQVCVFWADPKK